MSDRLVHAIRRRRPLRIVAYRSYGTADAVVFRGRVLANRVLSAAQSGESRWRAAARMAERFLSREVGGIMVHAELGAGEANAVTDGEGYFSVGLPAGPGHVDDAGWVAGRARTAHDERTWWRLEALTVGPGTERVVISDVDDTLLANGAGDVLRTVLATVGGSALTRRPVPGTPELYRALAAPTPGAPACPVFYVSSSPWNIYDFLVRFLAHHDFPKGPLLLRDIGLDESTLRGAHGRHKVDSIRAILAACPNARVALIGDSSQHDAAAFAEVIEETSDRVVGAFIRDVGHPEKAAAVMQTVARTDGRMSLVTGVQEIRHRLREGGWFD